MKISISRMIRSLPLKAGRSGPVLLLCGCLLFAGPTPGLAWTSPELEKAARTVITSLQNKNALAGKKLAVASFKNRSTDKTCSLSKLLSASVLKILHEYQVFASFDVLTREDLDAVEQEILLKSGGSQGSRDEGFETISLLGSADLLVTGSYSPGDRNRFELILKALSIEKTGVRQLAFETLSIPASGLPSSDAQCLHPEKTEIPIQNVQAEFAFLDNNNRRMDSGARVTLGDQYTVQMKVDQQSWVYIFDIDGKSIFWPIFPLNGVALSNPLQPGRKYALPGDDKRYQFDPTTGKESFFIVISLKPLGNLETLMDAASRQQLAVSRSALFGINEHGDSSQEVLAVKKEFSGLRGGGILIDNYDGPAASADVLFEKLRSDNGVIIRTLELEHY